MNLSRFYIALICLISFGFTSEFSVKIAKLKYDGGGDWYANRTALSNFANFCNSALNNSLNPADDVL